MTREIVSIRNFRKQNLNKMHMKNAIMNDDDVQVHSMERH